ncbi:protein asteroid homolog 1 isoform X1 [Scleropages formosus]|nr:protein asteroid homolog 1 isoform X1 [Scleropages formosus]XP_018597194.1 protein asteroid homolog 1 isoform X1 [Scleropages formosus]XP_018597195.1 protein asteroid homolog 1 isoform X1 [Scleropages formosus]
MGVQGLTSYMEKNRHFLQHLKVRNTTLIIDGCSLYYKLYFTSGLNQEHGGDYDSFALLVNQFFEALSACQIQPFVVLDGGMDPTDKKFRTMKERLQGKIKEASSLSRGASGSILPLLTKETFVQVLRTMCVPLVQCPFEADWEIAALANQWNCAVLTSDSDFYIFDLKAGYLPLAYFQWGNMRACKSTSGWYIPACGFSVDQFCAHFNNMSKALLPLFAVIIGNDYVNLQATKRLFSHIDLPKSGRAVGSRMHSRIDSLLHWLAGFTGPEQAMEAALGFLASEHRGVMQATLSSGLQDYELSSSNLALFFARGFVPTADLPEPLGRLPEWILRALSEAQLTPMVADVLVLQRALLAVQVENCRLPSSHTASKSIRQLLYGLLLNWKQKLSQKVAVCGQDQRKPGCGWGQGRGPSLSDDPYCVEEFDRHDLNLRRVRIQAALPRLLQQLPLERLNMVPLPVRRQLLLETLGVDESLLHTIPLSLQLPLCVTCHWMSNCSPRPSMTHVQALLLGMVYGEICRQRAVHRGPAEACPALTSISERLDQLHTFKGQRRGTIDLDTAHLYSQWQSCLWSSFNLNQLLCCPLPEPVCAWLYSGTLVHHVVRELKAGATSEALLGGAVLSKQLYSNLLGAVWRLTETALSSAISCSSKKKRRGRKQTVQKQPGTRRRGQATDVVPSNLDINNRFALLVVDDGVGDA